MCVAEEGLEQCSQYAGTKGSSTHVQQRRLPGSARLTEWCYGEDANLVCVGRLMSSHTSQQGCPLMLPLLCAMQTEMRKRVDLRVEGIGHADFVADFADDGVDGGGL